MKRLITIAAAASLLLIGTPVFAATEELPPGAKPGECYARVFVPATYETSTERVVKQEGSSKISVVPAKYTWADERVLIKEAGERLDVVPAKYEWAEEKILVKPASTVWKTGRGPIEKINGHTGEIMCLVEEPAVYRTVRKRVLKSPASTRTVSVPAEYKTVRVQKMVSPPKEVRSEIPAEYETLTKRSLATDGRVQWKSVLCETNLSRDVVTSIQRSLKTAGYDPGMIDGVIGRQTLEALRGFQKAKGLAQGYLTIDTLRALNVRVGA